ncbi:MAG: helix-turn-helix domain-containing protein [Mycobacterium sp.]
MSQTPTPSRGGRGARERILTASARLFYRAGIHATGVDRIAREAHVSKRTFYQHFPSKVGLVEEYLGRIDAAGGSPYERALDTEGAPRSRLLAIFEPMPTGRFRGCPFHNAAVESAGELTTVDELVRTHKLAFVDRLVTVATAAGARDPSRLGHQLAVLFDGGNALATSLNDQAPLVYARSAAEELIDAATS